MDRNALIFADITKVTDFFNGFALNFFNAIMRIGLRCTSNR
jgi:hypothetical protein